MGDVAFIFVRRCSFLFRRDFKCGSSLSDDKPSRGCAFQYRCSYECTFVMGIFIKRGLFWILSMALHVWCPVMRYLKITWIKKLNAEMCFPDIKYKTRRCEDGKLNDLGTCKALNLYSADAGFESRPEHRLSWLRCLFLVPPGKWRDRTSIRPRLVPSKSFPFFIYPFSRRYIGQVYVLIAT
jgi:hypothetical protein